MASTKLTHVYDGEGGYTGFFLNDKDANAWMRRQPKDRGLHIRAGGPPRRGEDAPLVDNALTTAIAATKAEEATHAVPPTGKTG